MREIPVTSLLFEVLLHALLNDKYCTLHCFASIYIYELCSALRKWQLQWGFCDAL
ncbi:hypothetical protein IV72_GL000383 [Atopobium minutum]|nr:hypothetical protein IV72_GL000383 [Atopobium minutum]